MTRGRLAFFEVAADGVPDVGAEVLPGVCLGDDGVSESTRDEAALGLVFADLKDDLVHGFIVSRAGGIGKKTTGSDPYY